MHRCRPMWIAATRVPTGVAPDGAFLAGVSLVATGSLTVVGALVVALAGVSVIASGANGAGASLVVELDGVTVESAGSVTAAGDATVTLDGVTVESAASLNVDGAAALTLDGVTVAATGATTSEVTGGLTTTLDGVTVVGAGSVLAQGDAAVTLDGVTLDATGYIEQVVTVDGARWSDREHDYDLGVGGSSLRWSYLTVGADRYKFFLHDAVTNTGVQPTGPDPGDFEAVLSGMTGDAVNLPQGNSTPEELADLLVTVMAADVDVVSARAADSANPDGGWNVYVRSIETIAVGTRPWASRGAAGIHGSHVVRMPRGVEVTGAASIAVSRLVGVRIAPPAADDRVWAVRVALGDTVDSGAQRLRLQYWASTATTTPSAGTEMVFDFGQLPADQVVPGRVARIPLTPTECRDFAIARAAITGTSHWMSLASTEGNSYNGTPVGGDFAGETAGENVRVERTAGTNDATVAQTAWSATDEVGFPVIVPLGLVYDNAPCTTGERHQTWGAFADFATYGTFGNDVGLPDSTTQQTASVTGLEGGRFEFLRTGAVSGSIDYSVFEGGTLDPDAPSARASTLLWDAGLNTTNGAGTIIAPTGAGTIRVPAGGMFLRFKGQGAVGRGQFGPGPFAGTGNIDQPSDWVRLGGANLGQNPAETDIVAGAGYGAAAVDWDTRIPSTGNTESLPGNHPGGSIEVWQAPLVAA